MLGAEVVITGHDIAEAKKEAFPIQEHRQD